MKSATKTTIVLLAAGALLAGGGQAARAQTDVTYGGDARYFAMGGAGVALLQERSGSRINPASIAYETQPYALLYPTIGFRASEGTSTGAVSNFLISGQKLNDARDIAREFGKRDSEFGVNGNVGLRIGKIEASVSGIGRGRILPNAPFAQWVNDGAVGTPPIDSRSDVYAAGYYVLPAIAGATTLPNKNTNSAMSYAVGGRLKYMRGVYTHYVANADQLYNGDSAGLAPELNGNKNITKNGVGLDLGFLARPRRSNAHLSYAAVIANAIKPNFNIDGTDRNGNPTKFKLLATTITTGLAYQKNGATFAADLTDITRGAGNTQLRLGLEQKLIGNIYIRSGYNSANGFSYGAGLFGFDIAVGKKQPLELVKTLNF